MGITLLTDAIISHAFENRGSNFKEKKRSLDKQKSVGFADFIQDPKVTKGNALRSVLRDVELECESPTRKSTSKSFKRIAQVVRAASVFQQSIKAIPTKEVKKQYSKTKTIRKLSGFVQGIAGVVLRIFSKAKGPNVESKAGPIASGIGLPFTIIDIPLSAVGFGLAVKSGKTSSETGDVEGLRDAFSNGTFMITSLASSSLDTVAGFAEVCGNAPLAGTVAVPATIGGIVVLSLYAGIEVNKALRLSRMLDRLKKIDEKNAHKSDRKRILASIKHLRSLTQVTKKEKALIEKKYSDPVKIKKALKKKRKEKQRRLKRRLGKAMSQEVIEKSGRLTKELQDKNNKNIKKSILEGKLLVAKTRNKINKSITSSILGITGAVLGIIGLVLILTASAPVLPYVFLGAAVAILIAQFVFDGSCNSSRFYRFSRDSGGEYKEFWKVGLDEYENKNLHLAKSKFNDSLLKLKGCEKTLADSISEAKKRKEKEMEKQLEQYLQVLKQMRETLLNLEIGTGVEERKLLGTGKKNLAEVA